MYVSLEWFDVGCPTTVHSVVSSRGIIAVTLLLAFDSLIGTNSASAVDRATNDISQLAQKTAVQFSIADSIFELSCQQQNQSRRRSADVSLL